MGLLGFGEKNKVPKCRRHGCVLERKEGKDPYCPACEVEDRQEQAKAEARRLRKITYYNGPDARQCPHCKAKMEPSRTVCQNPDCKKYLG